MKIEDEKKRKKKKNLLLDPIGKLLSNKKNVSPAATFIQIQKNKKKLYNDLMK